MIRFVKIEDFTEENVENVIREFEELYEKGKQQSKLLLEQKIPEFDTAAEAQEYFGDLSFSEWENNMKEKYGL
jgi:hypothetical protein